MKTPKCMEVLVQDGLVDEVIRQLMSGKEATVYVVRCGDCALAQIIIGAMFECHAAQCPLVIAPYEFWSGVNHARFNTALVSYGCNWKAPGFPG